MRMEFMCMKYQIEVLSKHDLFIFIFIFRI